MKIIEVEREVTVSRTELLCEVCNLEMTPNGQVSLTHPPQYIHKCANGHRINITGKKYPYINYTDVQE